MSGDKSLRTFFRYMLIGFVVSSIRSDISHVPLIAVVKTLFLTFMYNFIVGIWFGLTAMFGMDLYEFLKKKLRNEQYSIWGLFFGNSVFRHQPNGRKQFCAYFLRLFPCGATCTLFYYWMDWRRIREENFKTF